MTRGWEINLHKTVTNTRTRFWYRELVEAQVPINKEPSYRVTNRDQYTRSPTIQSSDNQSLNSGFWHPEPWFRVLRTRALIQGSDNQSLDSGFWQLMKLQTSWWWKKECVSSRKNLVPILGDHKTGREKAGAELKPQYLISHLSSDWHKQGKAYLYHRSRKVTIVKLLFTLLSYQWTKGHWINRN